MRILTKKCALISLADLFSLRGMKELNIFPNPCQGLNSHGYAFQMGLGCLQIAKEWLKRQGSWFSFYCSFLEKATWSVSSSTSSHPSFSRQGGLPTHHRNVYVLEKGAVVTSTSHVVSLRHIQMLCSSELMSQPRLGLVQVASNCHLHGVPSDYCKA